MQSAKYLKLYTDTQTLLKVVVLAHQFRVQFALLCSIAAAVTWTWIIHTDTQGAKRSLRVARAHWHTKWITISLANTHRDEDTNILRTVEYIQYTLYGLLYRDTTYKPTRRSYIDHRNRVAGSCTNAPIYSHRVQNRTPNEKHKWQMRMFVPYIRTNYVLGIPTYHSNLVNTKSNNWPRVPRHTAMHCRVCNVSWKPKD